MAKPMTEYRLAKTDELKQLKAFLFHHGANPWNHLPLDGVNAEFALIAAGKGSALAAYRDDQPVGLAIFYHPNALPKHYLEYSHARSALYIAEVVVHKDYSGRGIGTNLLKEIIRRAADFGAEILLVDRHSENVGSAGMMRKAGFKELATFVDLDRRDFGNRSTTVLSLDLG
jgi:GNAT superfamily N-acetyltransferase